MITQLEELAELTDYSLLASLNCDPDATKNGQDHLPRQVFSGHFVPVKPTPLPQPEYVIHSKALFQELGFAEELALTDGFQRLFSGDLSQVPSPMKKVGWATGYALSIFGTEYSQQCPFQTGNGYGDGRAISVLEAVAHERRYEMQLKGAGRTPYCRGADGRAVLRSSAREFLAQEHMHALGIKTSRSLSLFVSKSERVNRPWYQDHSRSEDPDIMNSEPVAITTRVAPSFLRVGQLELFGRRARNNQNTNAIEELEMIVIHLIDREYKNEIGDELTLTEKVLLLAKLFANRLAALVANWIRVGYCQGNFNSDNCACGGFTLDYGPFGFCENFDPTFQPWVGGGRHFSFLNQPLAAEKNFTMFCTALKPLIQSSPEDLSRLDEIESSFLISMQAELESMWASKLGLESYDSDLVIELLQLMVQTSVDYTIFFRELSSIPEDLTALVPSFYKMPTGELEQQWHRWLVNWRKLTECEVRATEMSIQMKQVNPKYIYREWLVVPAYQQAARGNYALLRELYEVFSKPFDEQDSDIEEKYYRLKPSEYFHAGGISHYSCSS